MQSNKGAKKGFYWEQKYLYYYDTTRKNIWLNWRMCIEGTHLDWRKVIEEENSRMRIRVNKFQILEMLCHRILCNRNAGNFRTWSNKYNKTMWFLFSMSQLSSRTWFEWTVRPLMSVYIVGTTCKIKQDICSEVRT